MDLRLTESDLTAGRAVLARMFQTEPDRWLLASTTRQTLWLLVGSEAGQGLRISTAAAGIDAREGSGGTPPGLHTIAEKIGAGEAAGTEFVSRRATGRVWTPDDYAAQEDLILSRILVLDGLEPGVNQGPGIDSRERYIYIHGTNHENLLGRPVSHGCLRLANDDLIRLFERVKEGDPLAII